MRETRPVTVLAMGGVAATMSSVAIVAHALVDGLSWPAAFVLGAAVSPTDTVAAKGVFRRLGVPERVTTLVEGESLVNDGVALVLYRVAIGAALSGGFSLVEGGLELLVTGAGGAAVGLAVAWLIGELRRRLDEAMIEITVTLLTPYLAWIPAEELGLSGILAAVSSGLYLGWKGPELFAPSTRLQAYGFWAVLNFILESLLFILVGLQIPGIIEALEGRALGELIVAGVAVSVTVIVARLLVAAVTSARPALSRSERLVIGWSGMRGAVSLGVALAIPLQTDAGAAFPGREVVIFLTVAVIGSTLVLQGLTLPLLIARLGLRETHTGERRVALARFRTVEAALGRVGELTMTATCPTRWSSGRGPCTPTARASSPGLCRAGVPVDEQGDEDVWRRVRRDLIAVERRALLELREQGAVTAAVVTDVERELDLEEERVRPPQPATAPCPPSASSRRSTCEHAVAPRRPGARPRPRPAGGGGGARAVRRLPVPLLRRGLPRGPRGPRAHRRARGLRLPPLPAGRQAPARGGRRPGGRGGRRPGPLLGDAQLPPLRGGPAASSRPACASTRASPASRTSSASTRSWPPASTSRASTRTSRAGWPAASRARPPSSWTASPTAGSTTPRR